MKYARDLCIVAALAAGMALLVAWETDYGWGAIASVVGLFTLALAVLPALAGEHSARHAPALFWSNPLAEVYEQAERDDAEWEARERREGRKLDLTGGRLSEIQAWWPSRLLPVAVVMLVLGWRMG